MMSLGRCPRFNCRKVAVQQKIRDLSAARHEFRLDGRLIGKVNSGIGALTERTSRISHDMSEAGHVLSFQMERFGARLVKSDLFDRLLYLSG